MEFSIDLVAPLIGMDANELRAQFTETVDGAEKTLEGEALAEKLKSLAKAHETNILTAGRKAGARERMTDFEKNLRSTYGIPDQTEGEKLVAKILAKHGESLTSELEALKSQLSEKDSKKLADLPLDEQKKFIANHPYFAEQTAALQKAIADKEAEFLDYKKTVEGKAISNRLRSEAKDFVHNEYRAVLPEDSTIANTLLNAFLDNLEKVAVWKEQENDLLPYDANGERITENYKAISKSQFFEIQAKNWFKQHPADPNKAAPGKTNGAQSGMVMPDWSKMTKEQIFQTVLNEKDPAKAKALQESADAFLK